MDTLIPEPVSAGMSEAGIPVSSANTVNAPAAYASLLAGFVKVPSLPATINNSLHLILASNDPVFAGTML